MTSYQCLSLSHSAPLLDIFQNLIYIHWDLSRPRKVKSDDAVGSTYMTSYQCLIVRYRDIWPNSAPLRDKNLRNLKDLEFDFSRSPKVTCNGVLGLPIHICLLVSNSNNMSISHNLLYSWVQWPIGLCVSQLATRSQLDYFQQFNWPTLT